MKRLTEAVVVIFLVCCLMTTMGSAQNDQKLAQTGFQFLSVVSDARGAAMGEAMTSLQTSSSSLFFNPAGMAEMKKLGRVSGTIEEPYKGILYVPAFPAPF